MFVSQKETRRNCRNWVIELCESVGWPTVLRYKPPDLLPSHTLHMLSPARADAWLDRGSAMVLRACAVSDALEFCSKLCSAAICCVTDFAPSACIAYVTDLRLEHNNVHMVYLFQKTAPWEFQTKLLHYFFMSNYKSNLHSLLLFCVIADLFARLSWIRTPRQHQ